MTKDDARRSEPLSEAEINRRLFGTDTRPLPVWSYSWQGDPGGGGPMGGRSTAYDNGIAIVVVEGRPTRYFRPKELAVEATTPLNEADELDGEFQEELEEFFPFSAEEL